MRHNKTHDNTHTRTHLSILLLVRGRVVYFGPNGPPAIDYVRALPAASGYPPYQPGLNDAVGLTGG